MRAKRMLIMMLVLCMVTTLFPATTLALDVPTSGKAGDNITWTMHDDGTLVFSGSGATIDNKEHTVQAWSSYHAESVEHIVFEEGVTYIGQWLFNTAQSYRKLESVTIPSTVTAIGKYAFNDLAGYLKKVYIRDLRKWCAIDFRGSGANPFECEADMYLNNELVETLVIPSTVSEIPDRAFFCCSGIKTIVIPGSVKTIGNLSFGSCNNLVKVVFEGNAPTVDGKLFTNTKPFVYYPETNKTWTEAAIQTYDSGATWVAYDPATEDVVSDSFPGGEAVGSIKWRFDEETGTMTFYGSGSMIDSSTTASYTPWRSYQKETKKVVLEEGITRIGKFAFYDFSQVKEIVLPSTLQTIGDGAFYRCTNLEKINIPDSVTDLGVETFSSCQKLTGIKIPSSVTEIPNRLFENCTDLADVTLPDGITVIGAYAFFNCSLTDIEIPESVTLIGTQAFSNSLKESCTITFPQSMGQIAQGAFANCSGIEKISFVGNAPSIDSGAFNHVKADVYYPADNETWTAEVKQNYGGTLTWIAHDHDYIATVTEPTCTEPGYTTHVCSGCQNTIIDTHTAALGHSMEQWTVTATPTCTEPGEKQGKCSRCEITQTEPVPQTGHTWNDETLLIKTCTVCGALDGGYRIDLDAAILGSATSVCVDGKDHAIQKDGSGTFVILTETNATNLVAYTFNDPNATDIHTQYPTAMKVWVLSFTDGSYQARYVKEFDDLLQYSGSSIRIVGVKGIRMITSIEKAKRSRLIKGGLAGYTLVEYGTALAWASDLEGGNPLVLGKNYTKSNFAYKRGVKDPIFKTTASLIQYTNVLVGFNDDQCIPDIVMRPYIILKNADGEQITIYGGQVHRNIGYIAYQNRNAFKAGSAAYKYVWGIIHHVYGDQYDEEYKG